MRRGDEQRGGVRVADPHRGDGQRGEGRDARSRRGGGAGRAPRRQPREDPAAPVEPADHEHREREHQRHALDRDAAGGDGGGRRGAEQVDGAQEHGEERRGGERQRGGERPHEPARDRLAPAPDAEHPVDRAEERGQQQRGDHQPQRPLGQDLAVDDQPGGRRATARRARIFRTASRIRLAIWRTRTRPDVSSILLKFLAVLVLVSINAYFVANRFSSALPNTECGTRSARRQLHQFAV